MIHCFKILQCKAGLQQTRRHEFYVILGSVKIPPGLKKAGLFKNKAMMVFIVPDFKAGYLLGG